jgi:molybdopterin-containing oxidoreductase family membrane subunit
MGNSEALHQPQLVTGGKTWSDVNNDVSAPLEKAPPKMWWVLFAIAVSCMLIGKTLSVIMFTKGLGVLGLNQPNG